MAINNLNTGVGISPTIVDAKGDLIVATGADAVNRLAVGTANQQLVVDSSTSTGLKWAAPAGLVLLNTTSFSGVASQSVNDVFSSTYRNYYLVMDITSAATNGSITMRMRASGSDTSANYQSNRLFHKETTVACSENPTGTDDWYTGVEARTDANDGSGFTLTLFRPQLAENTVFTSQGSFFSGNIYGTLNAGVLADATQYDGFTLIFPGNTTGRITTYGLAN